MKKFARLIENEPGMAENEQILVTLTEDEDDGDPVAIIQFDPDVYGILTISTTLEFHSDPDVNYAEKFMLETPNGDLVKLVHAIRTDLELAREEEMGEK